MRFSSGLYDLVLDDGFDSAFTGPVLEIRTGTQPASADDASVGSTLCTITLPSPMMGVAASGVKSLDTSWVGTVVADGTATWFRIKSLADAGGSSSTLPRIDGSLSTTLGDIVLDAVALVSGDTVTITDFKVTTNTPFFTSDGTGTLA